jgi:type II secretory pathway pseudopilin PulG
MIIVMVMGLGLAATGTLWSHAAQRDKERELLFVGHQFRDAIASYYSRSPGVNAYPKTLDELVEDRRFPQPLRHLRRIYADPLTGKAEWGLAKAPDGTIMGVYSLSEATPVKTGNFDNADAAFEDAKKYAEWQFVFLPPKAPATAPAASNAAPKG